MAKKKSIKKPQSWFNHSATKLGAATVNLYKKQPPLPQPKVK
jgi:hypothetical protein